MSKFEVLILIFLVLLPAVGAHQPRLVMGETGAENDPIIVKDPEVSKAYYGELGGRPDYYLIDSGEPFVLYLNILVPAIPVERDRRFSVEVLEEGERVLLLDGAASEWVEFFEEYGRDTYLQGPEARKELGAGTYIIKVFSADNVGRYSLAVGELESFPPKEILKTVILLPLIKLRFFDRPLLAALLLIGLAGVVVFLLRRPPKNQ